MQQNVSLLSGNVDNALSLKWANGYRLSSVTQCYCLCDSYKRRSLFTQNALMDEMNN